MNDAFSNLEYTDDYGYEGDFSLRIFGQEQTVCLHICTDDDSISASQDASFTHFLHNIGVIEDRIVEAILEYYNGSEKNAYGPDDPQEMALWWPDIDTADQMKQHLTCDMITVFSPRTDEPDEKIQLGISFSRDWGGEDLDDNGVAVVIRDGMVEKVGYKDIAI